MLAGGEKGNGVDTGRPAESKWTRKTGEDVGVVSASKGGGSGGKRDDSGQGKETTGDVLGKVLRVLLRRLLVGGRAVTGSDSDALFESESDESARQEKALGLAKREVTVGEKILSVSGRVRVGLVLSCLWISACLALSVRTTDGEEEKKDTVARGIDQETEGLRDSGEEHRTDEGGDVGLAARARTRLGFSPSDLRLIGFCPSDLRLIGKAGKTCMLVSS